MKKLTLAIILLMTTFAFAAGKTANYAGNWTLDKAQSKNPAKYYENIKSHKLVIAQDEKRLSVGVEIILGENAPDKFDFVYKLDGTETKSESKVRTPNGLINVPTTLKAIGKDDGKLQITITREVPMGDSTFKGITTEDWQLSADGKTLTIHKVDETPRGKMESDMVFVKE